MKDGERKLVTVLFTDIVGSTALAENLDPEDWADIVAGAHAVVQEAVERYDGRVAQFLGDGALAFFGAPTAHEDDPERAVSAALAIIGGVAEYGQELRRAGRVADFRMRVGLNTGLVVVGSLGAGKHVEYLAVGDSVNLASRMQGAAEPNTVLLAEATARAVEHAFELQPIGRLELKGKSEPVAAFRAVAPRRVARSRRGIAGLDSPIVGRDPEIALLRDRLEALGAGLGGIVSIMGEAGLGKSRLASEIVWRGSAAFTRMEGRCLSFQTTTPFAPFIDLFTRHFALAEAETDAQKYARVGDPYLAALLGVAPPGEEAYVVQVLEPPLLRERIAGAVVETVSRLADERPIVIVIEDMHWADSASLDLMQRLLPLAERQPVLLAAVFRPDDSEPAWRFHRTALANHGARYTPILLAPLTPDQARTLVANLLEIEDLPESVRAMILAKAEGNPFYVEEVIRSLLDARLVVRDGDRWRATRDVVDVSVPDTLAGVITARLDRLDDASKRAAQTASVIGREFGRALLADVVTPQDGLDDALRALESRELIRADDTAADAFRFKHVLTQEAAYNSLLLSRRKELHRRVAESLERSAPEAVADIGRHLVAAQEPARALPYVLQAADRAARNYATPEAVALYSQALDIAKRLDDAAAARRSFEGLGGAFSLAYDAPRAIRTYQELEDFAAARADTPMRVSALNKAAYVLSMLMGDFAGAMGRLLESERLARSCGDKPGLSEHIVNRCMLLMAAGDFDGTAHYMGEVVELGRELQLGSQMAYGLTHTASALTYMTRFDEAWEKALEAQRLAEALGDKRHLAEVMVNPLTFGHLRNGDVEAAIATAMAGADLAARIGGLYEEGIGQLMAAWMAVLRGDYEPALALFDRAEAVGVKSGLQFVTAIALSMKAEVLAGMGNEDLPQIEAALGMLESPMGGMGTSMAMTALGKIALLRGDAEQARARFLRGLTAATPHRHTQRPLNLAGLADVALAEGKLDEAAAFVAEARAYAADRGMRYCLPEIDHVAGRVEAARRNDQAAIERFDAAGREAARMGFKPILWRAHECAADVLLRQGHFDEARAKRREADRVVAEVAGRLTHPARRAGFLAATGRPAMAA